MASHADAQHGRFHYLTCFDGITMVRCPIACCLIGILAGMAGQPTSADDASTPVAQWIWTANRGDARAYLRTTFRPEGEVVHATITALSEFCDAEWFLNGSSLGKVENYGQPLRSDVTLLLVAGNNSLAVQATASDGPSAVAMRLEIELKGGRRLHYVTGRSWQAANHPLPGWPAEGEEGSSSSAVSYGAVEQVMWRHPSIDTGVSETDDYTQWKQAIGSQQGTDPATFLAPPGFQVELLRSARPEEGSWISLAFDSAGNIIISREERGLLRLTWQADQRESHVEVIDDTLQECRGLLFAYGALYASANNDRALFRLRDTDGDGRFDEKRELFQLPGGLGHGRNDLALGSDGTIYAIQGDSVEIPRGIADRTSPLREHRRGAPSKEGFLLRFDADGQRREVVAAGLRNPYGIDFNQQGEAFTYDADAEFDMGAPWYRPTRIDHLVSGADFGWRGVTGSWPPYFPDHPDNAQPVLDIGKGSPTAVKFGARSHFPPAYRDALFVLDWSYGRILAVSMLPRGASYVARAETFVRGRPLNVTDLDFGPDGAMYFITGGRKTQSGLYRLRYVGPAVDEPVATPQQLARQEHAAEARSLRRRLEQLQGSSDPGVLNVAWPLLAHADPAIRYAARLVVEHQPLAAWRDRALNESRPAVAVSALTALARGAESADTRTAIVQRLNELAWHELPQAAIGSALHTYALCLAEARSLNEATVQRLSPCFPHSSPSIDAAMARLLVSLEDAHVVPKLVGMLDSPLDQRSRMHLLFVLRDAQRGWTPNLRRRYASALADMRQFQGGEGMPKFIRQIQADALKQLSAAERAELEPLLAGEAAAIEDELATPRTLVKQWQLADLPELLEPSDTPRNLERGREVFAQALCIRCHRVGTLGAAVGPDLTGVARRFSRRDMLLSILDPSAVVAEQYRRAEITTTDGRVLVGQIVPTVDFRSPVLRIAADPLRPEQITEVAKSDIESHSTSSASTMPVGLLNSFTKAEILDLLAWLERGGDQAPSSPAR